MCAAVVVVASASTLLAKRPRPPLCTGRYLLEGDGLVIGTRTPDAHAFSVSAAHVSLGGCLPAGAHVKATRAGTKIHASWMGSACRPDLTGRLRLRALIEPTCALATGSVKVPHARPIPLRAQRSQCGDGIVDGGNGEECDGGTGCDPSIACTTECHCEPRPTTSTTSSTSSTLPSSSTTTTVSTTSSTTEPAAATTTTTTGVSMTTLPPVTTTTPDGAQIRWASPPPSVVESGQDLAFEIEVTGCGPAVEGDILVCPSDVPVAACEGSDAVQIDPDGGYFYGAPGTFGFTAGAFDCAGPEDFYLVPRVFVDDALGNAFGPVFGPVAPLRVRAPAASSLAADPPALAFAALAGQTPAGQTLSLASACGNAFPYAASADAPWVAVTPPSGNLRFDGTKDLTVRVDPTAFPADGSADATITVTSPALPHPLTVPVGFDAGHGIAARWTTGAPASVASDQPFALELEVSGSFETVEGDVVACTSDVAVDDCTDSGIFDLGDDAGSFFGAPGTFAFSARGFDCLSEDLYLVARYVVRDADGNERGPFVSPVTPTHVLPPPAPLLEGDPPALVFNAAAGQAPPSQTVTVFTVCEQRLAFGAAASVPWLTVAPAGATIPKHGSVDVVVGVDLAGLDPAASPFGGSISLTAGAGAGAFEVPVTLDLLGDLTVRWTTPAPAVVSSDQPFALAFEVGGSVTGVEGQIVSCAVGEPVEGCADSGLFDLGPDAGAFSGPPGTFGFQARGFDCDGPESLYVAAQLFVTDAAGNVLGPFLTPLTSTSLLAPPGPVLRTDPDSLVFDLLGGQGAQSQTVTVFTVCGDAAGWTDVAASVPWLVGVPAQGTIQAGDSADMTVTVDPSRAAPLPTPLDATLTLTTTASHAPVTVPVTLEVLQCTE